MKISTLVFFASISLCPLGGRAFADIYETFDDPILLAPPDAPGAWYRDRFVPAGFESQVYFDGDYRLRLSVSSADGTDNRPPQFQTAFYDVQGRKLDLGTGAIFASVDLYVPEEWETTGRRMAGFWSTAFADGVTNVASAFTVFEFTSDNDNPRFRAFDPSVGYVDMGLPTGFSYNSWYRLNLEISNENFTYSVGDLSREFGALGSDYIGNVMLQGYNTKEGVDYVIHWDNLIATVPEPSTFVYLGLSIVSILAARRRKAA